MKHALRLRARAIAQLINQDWHTEVSASVCSRLYSYLQEFNYQSIGLYMPMRDEVEQARKVLAERDKIIADAQRHADSMVAQAKDYIAKLTEESEIVRQSQEHANQIIQNANHSSEDLRNSSVTYAGQVLQYVESTLEKTLASVRQNREGLVQSNRQESNK